MLNRYVYKEQDITLDVIMKIEHVAKIISDKQEVPFDDCLYRFYKSKAYEALQKTESLMWAESAEFIVDEYFREILELV